MRLEESLIKCSVEQRLSNEEIAWQIELLIGKLGLAFFHHLWSIAAVLSRYDGVNGSIHCLKYGRTRIHSRRKAMLVSSKVSTLKAVAANESVQTFC